MRFSFGQRRFSAAAIVVAGLVVGLLPEGGRGQTTVTFQQGTAGYSGSTDRRITLTTGTATPTSATIDGQDTAANSGAGDNAEAQYFIKFDSIFGSGAGQIPLGATILSSSLRVTTGSVTNDNSGGYFLISGMRSDFSTRTAITQLGTGTGSAGTNGPTYANSGATIGYGSLRAPALNTAYTIPLGPGLLQQWADGTLTNNGLVIQAYTTDAWGMLANGNTTTASRPQLSVTYTTQPTTIASLKQNVAGYSGMTAVIMNGVTGATTNTTAAAGMALDGPTSATPPGDSGSPDQFGLLKFDGIVGSAADQVPVRASVTRSWLVLTTQAGSNDESSGPFSVFRMLTAWDSTSTYAGFGPQGPVSGTHFAASATGTSGTAARNSQAWVDVTSAISAWKDGAANHGLLVRAGTTDGWTVGSGGNSDPTRRPELRTAYSVDSVVWKGSVDGSWDKGSAVGTGGTANWQLQQGATATNFVDTDRVVFDDSTAGSGPVAVTLGGGVSPQRVTFANASRDYTVSGGGAIGGAGSLVKQGAATAILATANTFTGGTTIEAGTLQIGAGGDMGSLAGPIAVQSGARLAIDRTGSLDLPGVISGAGSLVKSGGGRATLSAAATLSGPVTVSAGTLAMRATTAAGGITVADAATFATTSGGTPQTFSTPTLALGGTGSTLRFELGSVGNPAVPLVSVTGSDGFSPSTGSHTLAVSTTGSLGLGRFTLIDYVGAPISSGFSLAPLPQRLSGGLVYDATNTAIDLDITGVDVVRWRGSASTAWDSGSAIDVGGTANWRLTSNSAATNFVAGDKLVFDDAADSGTVVLAAGTLAPGEITVNNSARDYVFSGSGSIGGSGALTKQGTGRLTLLVPATSPGAVTASGGTLQVGDGSTPSSLAGPATVSSGGRLELANGTLAAVTVDAGGTFDVTAGTVGGLLTSSGTATLAGGTLAAGAAVNAGTLALGAGGAIGTPVGDIAVAAAATLTFNHDNNLTFAGRFTGTGSIRKTGPGRLLFNSSSPWTGVLTIDGGEFRVEDATGGDLNASAIVVNSGGTFQFGNNTAGNPDIPDATFITLNTGGTVIWDEGENLGGLNLVGGTIDMRAGGLNAMATATPQQWTAGRLTSSGASAQALAGSSPIAKTGSGIVLLDGNASITTSGGVRIEEGTIQFATAANLGTANVTLGGVATAGRLQYDGATATRGGSFTLAAGGGEIAITTAGSELTLSGVLGGTGGGLAVAGPGTLILAGNNTFTGGTTIASGTLRAASGTALGTGGVTIQSGGRLVVAATLSMGTAAITTAAGGVLDVLSGASAPLAAGSSLTGFTSGSTSNTARILAGVAGGSGGSLAATWSAPAAATVSDVLELTTPTSGNAFVLSLGYTDGQVFGLDEADLRLGWLDENVGSPTFNQWVAAIDGNAANPVSLQAPFAGSWASYWTSFTSANPSATLADARGAYGVDASGNTAWAVIDHNSSFAVVVVPEPGTLGLAALGLAGLALTCGRARFSRLAASRLVRGGGLAALTLLLLARPASAIEFGMVRVQQNSTANTSAAVTLTAWAHSSQFQVAPAANSNRGDFGIQIGASRADDVTGGIFLAGVANNGRDNGEGNGIRYGEASMDSDASGWFVPMHDAATGGEYNFDFSAVYFPFAEGWVVGHARNAANTNGGVYDQIRTGTGASAVALGGTSGNRLVAPGTSSAPQSSLGTGRSDLYLEGVNALTDGLLFVNHGKNEANIATSRPAPAGTHFELQVLNYDGGTEHDPVAFAYVPFGTPGVTMGRIASHTTTVGSTTYYGARATTSQGEFSIQRVAAGSYDLKIPGRTTADGTLLVSLAGFESFNVDNIVTFEPLGDGTGWRIETRDLPLSTTATTGIGGQDMPSGQAVFDFLFLPTSSPPSAPGTRAGYRGNRVAAANYFVTEFTAANEASDMTANASVGTSGLGTFSTNRGDNAPGIGGAAIALAATGVSPNVMLASTSQGFRDNPLGADGYGLATVWNSGNTYVVATANNANTEMNVNFAVANFPATAGFVQAASVATTSGRATVSLDPAAGMLMATPLVNAGNLATIDVTGGAHVVSVVGNTGTLTSTTPFGYVFLPNDTPGLVSGRVTGSTGSITTGADTASATLTRTATGVYTLSLAAGRTPDTGMLLVNALAAGGEFDNFVVWEKTGADFTIRVLDAATSPTAVDGDFQFAYIPYDQSLAKSSDLAATSASLDLGKALVGTSVTAGIGVTATSPQSYTVTSFTATASGGLSGTAAGTLRGDTAGVAATGSLNVGLVAAASGTINGMVSLANLTDTSDTTGLAVATTLQAFEAASLTKGQAGSIASGGAVSLANAAAVGSLRADAEIVSLSVTGDSGWSVTGFTPGTTIAGGASESGIASFDATGRLNGTYSATLNIAVEHADLTIAGTAAGDLGQFSWTLSHQISGRTADNGQAARRQGESYQGLGLTRSQGRATAAAILHGQAGSGRTVEFGFRDAAAAPVLSDILDLTGTAGDPIVLSVSYDESLLGGMPESSLQLGWLDENGSSPTLNQWVAAIDGNLVNAVSLESPFQGPWATWWGEFQVANPGSPLSAAVGAYGVDSASNTAWAVIDHNSSFAVVVVPEPGTLGLVGLGLGGLWPAIQRRRRV